MKRPFSVFFFGGAALLILAGVLSLVSLRDERADSQAKPVEAPVVNHQRAAGSQSRTVAGADPGEGLETERPAFLERPFLSASLAALEKNGADLSLPMPSKHLVRCESPDIAGKVSAWGRDNGFEIGEPVIFLGHGGVEFFDVELRRTEVPDADRIQREGEEIHQAVGGVSGAEYATWVGEIVSR